MGKHKKRQPTIRTIVNPLAKELKFNTTCVIISRKPESRSNDFKTAVISFYDKNNAHTLGLFPKSIYEFSNIEKIRIKGLNISYYLEGNDIVINDLEEIFLIHEGSLLVIKGYQFEVERRKKR